MANITATVLFLAVLRFQRPPERVCYARLTFTGELHALECGVYSIVRSSTHSPVFDSLLDSRRHRYDCGQFMERLLCALTPPPTRVAPRDAQSCRLLRRVDGDDARLL